MDTLETARASADAVSRIASLFMLDAATYARGAELGFGGADFYFAGRGGALGAVDADVVSASLYFFNPAHVREVWQRSFGVMPVDKAAVEFSGCKDRWAAEHRPGEIDAARLADLAGRVGAEAGVAGAPLFAAWRAMPEPDDGDAWSLALHRMNVLRELRGARHGMAVLASGLTPLEAVSVKTPYMASLFGWEGELPERDPLRDRWKSAEELTNVLMAPAFEVLDDAERTEFVDLGAAALAAVTG